ncbi:SDR family NAD(P)-dependent oxidoreductase [Sphingobium boeckii]|uniref:NAD(P)-dependent dehydrogenase (Short-subunit alcohol dehydrogenase family) n=1 Tax=Sphingobium boeckii TaxID=1082345 RepID=A0A7W9AJB1_9SPHN|nr:NAD(P)-dependent dehydrogenase (short-subunit alcohol dehydrogenase family) [Sphingobium boeckii]
MNKIIVITGAGDGLGRALARRFAADGETVILLGRTLAKVQAVADELGAPHIALECDVTNPDSVRAAFAAIAARHPKIDVLINNAGVFEPFTLAEVRDDQLVNQLMTNLAGPIFCSRDALPLLRGGGHIINVSSESVSVKMPMLWMYAGTKVGLEFVSEMWARELEADGVRVTTVQAGQMMDETKTGSKWPMDVSMRFAQENAKVGLHLRERPMTHYNSVTDVFRAVLDMPADLHIGTVALSASRR